MLLNKVVGSAFLGGGVTALTYGVYLWSPILGYIIGGILSIALGILILPNPPKTISLENTLADTETKGKRPH